MRTLRNIAIILLLAFVVAEVPGGGNVARGLVAAITILFLAMFGALAFQLYRQNRLAYLGLTDGQRGILLAALGALVLMIAGADELLDTGLSVFVWLVVVGVSVYGLVYVFRESRSY